jgi:phage terminase small subunit
MSLNERQTRFAEEYAVDFNATQAAIRAGYSEKTAGASGWELLKKPEIQQRIEFAKAEQSKRTAIDADWVLQRLVQNADRAMQLEAVTDAQGNPTGEYTYQGSVANKALELIGRRVGFFPEDAVKVQMAGQVNHEHSGTVDASISFADDINRFVAAFVASASREKSGGVPQDGDVESVDT